MRPLRERTGPTFALEADAIDLLRAARAYETPPGQKQRVRAWLIEQRLTRRARVFRPVVTIAIVLLAAAASAAVGRHWIAGKVQTLMASPVPPEQASSVPPTRSATNTSSAVRVAEISSTSEAPEGVGPPAAAGPIAGARSVTANRPTVGMNLVIANGAAVARRTVGTRQRQNAVAKLAANQEDGQATSGENTAAPSVISRVSTPADPSRANHSRVGGPSDETDLVFVAMRALRQAGQPTRASRLLEEYLRSYPQGSLAEAALALLIEAAAVRGDPRARDLVRQYFSRYPSGHFEATVETARARLSP